MPTTVFAWIEELLQSGNTDAAFERLVERFRLEKQYWLIFDARMMKKRLDLGLPLVSVPALGDLPDAIRQPYQDASIQAAREVGELFLADGDIPGAWRYFRAIGDATPVIEALETFDPPEPDTPEQQDLLSSTVQIAYQEGVHPKKGFELILKHYGICRGITMFTGYPQQQGRDEAFQLLVRTLHGELVGNLKRAISNVEGTVPVTESVAELVGSRGWLFENNATYTDASHIVSVLRLSEDVKDKDTLKLVVELADYGSRLGAMFQQQDEPLFERGYEDRALYLKALLGENVEDAVSYFREKVARFDPMRYGTRPAEAFIKLLSRVGRYSEAIEVYRRYLADAAPEDPSCPTLLQLCQMSGDFEELKSVALERSDAVSYMAALLQSRLTRTLMAVLGSVALLGAAQQQRTTRQPAPLSVTVSEGTSMSVGVSPDGRMLAIDLQGSIWTLPAAGGRATRITDLYNDARQPVWSPDGKWIAFFAYRDGGYDIWAVEPDGAHQHKLTSGAFDDREPIWSHDGTRVAFSSDRGNPLGSDYNVWILEVGTGAVRQITKNPADDYMPTWSPDDREIAFASTREGGQSVWAVNVASGAERKVSSATGRVDAPSWGPGGQIVYHSLAANQSRFEVDGTPLTGGENVFPFRAAWTGKNDLYYVSDGKIRKRTLPAGDPQTIEFSATLEVTRAETTYTRRLRDFTSVLPRQVLGVVRPVISPDATQVAFAAVGDIYVMPMGGRPVNITKDAALDTDPAWSPDGSQLVYSSDKNSEHLQLWIRDMQTGQSRQVTHLTTQPQGATWSPDGKRIVFFNVDGMWRVAQISVLDVASGGVTKIHDTLQQPGTPTWSADGKRIALASIAPMTRRFREGTNQVLTFSATGGPAGDDQWYAPVPLLSIDSRGGCGPVWSPDGTKMAAIYEGVLSVWPVAPSGEPLGPPRRVTTESAHAPSWAGNSREILYQSLDKLRIVDIETGATRTVPLDLKYTPAIPTSRLLVHAGKLVDMKSPAVRSNVDITIEGNQITAVVPHAEGNHANGQVIDASNLTVMPGLTEFHSHLQKDFGAAQGRAFLAFGVTTVRSPGNTPYEAVEDREANEAGVRPGPRVYGTGYLMEWQRVYYKMGIAISTPAQFEMELQRAKVLQHDLIKSYVRLPDLQQKRMVEFAHSIGVPVATHEIYPAAFVGVDNTEHTAATSRRGYSPKQATLQSAYEDVIQLFGKSGRTFCPMITASGTRKLFEAEPGLATDPRFTLYPEWIQTQVRSIGAPGGPDSPGGSGKMVMDVMRAGGLVVAGTDTPNAMNLHGELKAYTMAGMTPFEALKAATVNPAKALGFNGGTIEAGKLADLVMVDGDPLADIANAHKVKRVIANGRLFEMSQLLWGQTP